MSSMPGMTSSKVAPDSKDDAIIVIALSKAL
jgi:hypothetical protein